METIIQIHWHTRPPQVRLNKSLAPLTLLSLSFFLSPFAQYSVPIIISVCIMQLAKGWHWPFCSYGFTSEYTCKMGERETGVSERENDWLTDAIDESEMRMRMKMKMREREREKDACASVSCYCYYCFPSKREPWPSWSSVLFDDWSMLNNESYVRVSAKWTTDREERKRKRKRLTHTSLSLSGLHCAWSARLLVSSYERVWVFPVPADSKCVCGSANTSGLISGGIVCHKDWRGSALVMASSEARHMCVYMSECVRVCVCVCVS